MAFAPFSTAGKSGVQLKSDLSEIASGIPGEVKEALKEQADAMAAAAKAAVPVDTGDLRDSIKVVDYNEPGRVGYRIVADAVAKPLMGSRTNRKTGVRTHTGQMREGAPYAHLVEYGSVHNQPARPFLTPQLWEKKDETLDAVAEALGRAADA